MIPPILLAAIALSTPSGTINHTATTSTQKEAPMAQGNPNSANPAIQFPVRHPNQPLQTTRFAAPGPGHRGAATGYPSRTGQNNMANMPMPTPVEHTNRPR